MKIQEMFSSQRSLDVHIVLEKRIAFHSLMDKKILALKVEVGELANELPEVFKFWSHKKNNYEKALKEYVDGLHFILSIGLEVRVSDYYADECDFNIGSRTKKSDPLKCFSKVFTSIETFSKLYEKEEFRKEVFASVLSEYATLGDSLGFTEQQIEQAYFEKNKVNHERQINGY